MSKDVKTLDVINVDASPSIRGYEGSFVLPLAYDVNITNDDANKI